MDLATLIGLVACLFFVVLGIVTGPQGAAAMGNFYDLTSIFVTLGGSACCVLVSCKSIQEFVANLKTFTFAVKMPQSSEAETIRSILEL